MYEKISHLEQKLVELTKDWIRSIEPTEFETKYKAWKRFYVKGQMVQSLSLQVNDSVLALQVESNQDKMKEMALVEFLKILFTKIS